MWNMKVNTIPIVIINAYIFIHLQLEKELEKHFFPSSRKMQEEAKSIK